MARLDWRASGGLVGTVLKHLSFTMLVPLAVGLLYGEDAWVFAASLVAAYAVGSALERLEPEPDLRIKEAILMVSLAWIAAAVVGSIPYVLAGYGTESVLVHPVNALFESTSGFTTTGATVMEEISSDRHSHTVLMWRQLTQWLGGMGIIVLMIATLPEVAVKGAQLMKSEAPEPSLQKLTPRIRETARALWLIYAGFTAVYVGLLYGLHVAGLAPEMDAYNAVAHGFSTLPTGGFSPQADSIAAFSPVVQWTVVPFMVIAGVNFALYWRFFGGDPRSMVDDVELKTYLGMLLATFMVLWTLLYSGAASAADTGGVPGGAVGEAARQAAFQICSLLNSTGIRHQ